MINSIALELADFNCNMKALRCWCHLATGHGYALVARTRNYKGKCYKLRDKISRKQMTSKLGFLVISDVFL